MSQALHSLGEFCRYFPVAEKVNMGCHPDDADRLSAKENCYHVMCWVLEANDIAKFGSTAEDQVVVKSC